MGASLCERRVAFAALVLTVSISVLTTLGRPVGRSALRPSSRPPAALGAWGLGVYVETRRKYRRELQRGAALHRARAPAVGTARRARGARGNRPRAARHRGALGQRDAGAACAARATCCADDPDGRGHTLGKVETSGEQSLVELRRILALLREPADGASRVRSRRSPARQLVASTATRGSRWCWNGPATSGRCPAASSSRSTASSRKR